MSPRARPPGTTTPTRGTRGNTDPWSVTLMTNASFDPAGSESEPADFEDEFDDWICGATLSKRSVPIYAKPGLFAEYEELDRERKVLDAAAHGEESLGDERMAEIDARLSDLYEEWMASKSIWIVRALLDDDYKAVKEGLTEPVKPVEPVEPDELPERHSLADERAHAKAVEKHKADSEKYADLKSTFDTEWAAYSTELNLRIVARAVVEIRFASGKISHGVTVDRLRKLQDTFGRPQIIKLLNNTQLATYEEPEIPAPFSSRTSEDDLT